MRMGLIFLLFVIAAACSSPEPSEASAKVVLEGRVLRGYGAPEEGVRLEIQRLSGGAAYVTYTQPDGRFRLQVPSGTYRVRMSKEGFAASERNGVVADGRNSKTFRIYPFFYKDWPAQAPTVNLIVEGRRYRLRVETVAPFRVAWLAVGGEPGYPFSSARQLRFDELPDGGWRQLDGSLVDGLSGDLQLHAVVYDQNNNRTHVSVPLHLEGPNPPEAELNPVEDLDVTSVTLSASALFLSGASGPAAPVVQLRWRPYAWPSEAVGRPHGFWVWRLKGDERELLGAYPGETTQVFDRALDGWGQELEYRVVPYLGNHEGPTAVARVTPLPPFSVLNLHPVDGEEVGPRPTFSWEISAEVGEKQYYYPLLWDHILGQTARSIVPGGFTEKTTLQFDETSLNPLWPGRPYGFELLLAYAVDDPERPRAFSVAVDRGGQLTGVPVYGPYHVFEVKP